MKKIFQFVLLFFILNKTNAQITYTVTQIPYQAESFLTGTALPVTTDDIFSSVIPIPFTFNFFGTNYNQFVVGSNGSVNFNFNLASSLCPWNIQNAIIPDTGFSFLHNSILAPFTDLNLSGGGIRYNTLGVPPFRKMVISFNSIPLFSCSDSLYACQVVLYEYTWDIEINMFRKPICTSWNAGNSILGIQNENGTTAYFPPNKNGNTQWSAFEESWRFSPSNGGSQNLATVSGRVYIDKNKNCVFDAGDSAKLFAFIRELNNPSIVAIPDSNGFFSFSLPIGNYTFLHIPTNGLETICPISKMHSVSITNANQIISNIDFADTIINSVNLNGTIDSTVLFSCVQNPMSFSISNNANLISDSTFLILTVSEKSYLSNFKQNGNLLQSSKLNDSTYLISLFGNFIGTTNITFNDSIPCETFEENSSKNYSIFVYSNIKDVDSSDNYFSKKLLVENFIKINKLQVKREMYNSSFKFIDSISPNEWTTFRFDIFNPYSDSAENLSIDIPIDTSKFDFFSYQVLSSSHPVSDIFLENHLVLDFKKIYLNNYTSSTNNHCFVEFKIKTRSPLKTNETIEAEGFVTMANQALRKTNRIKLVSELENGYWFFPNPMKESAEIYFPFVQNHTLLSLYDFTGRKVFSTYVDERRFTIKRNGLANGLYLLHLVEDNKIIYYNKIILE